MIINVLEKNIWNIYFVLFVHLVERVLKELVRVMWNLKADWEQNKTNKHKRKLCLIRLPRTNSYLKQQPEGKEVRAAKLHMLKLVIVKTVSTLMVQYIANIVDQQSFWRIRQSTEQHHEVLPHGASPLRLNRTATFYFLSNKK